MTEKYIVQNVGYPTTGVSESQWKDYSKHTSKRAAFRAVNKYRAHLEPGQWDDHYRVIDAKTREVVRLTEAEFYGDW